MTTLVNVLFGLGFVCLEFFSKVLLFCLCSINFREDCLMVASGIRCCQVVFLLFFNQEMLKCSKNSEGTAELEEALATVLDIIKSVNDSMHHVAITGYEVLFAVSFTLGLTSGPLIIDHAVPVLSTLQMSLVPHSWRMSLSGTLWWCIFTCQHSCCVEVWMWGGSGRNAVLLSNHT